MRARQRWLRAEIDEKDAALHEVRGAMRELIEEADRMQHEIAQLKERGEQARQLGAEAEERTERARRQVRPVVVRVLRQRISVRVAANTISINRCYTI